MPVIFRFLHCCGVRCGEARLLKVENVHLDKGYVDIMEAKGFRDRRLFLSNELIALLKKYEIEIRKIFPNREYFFPSTTGECYGMSSISRNFNIFWDAAGLGRLGNSPPRAYDFRHHFVFANINRWIEEGKDVNAMLPYIMRYMGHTSLKSTMYYIHLSPDLYHSYTSITLPLEAYLPEVEPYEK